VGAPLRSGHGFSHEPFVTSHHRHPRRRGQPPSPEPLEHLPNAKRGRYIMAGRRAVWLRARASGWPRDTGGKPVSTHHPSQDAPPYLTAPGPWSWSHSGTPKGARFLVRAAGLSVRWTQTNAPRHPPTRIRMATQAQAGASTSTHRASPRRDAQFLHAITRLIR